MQTTNYKKEILVWMIIAIPFIYSGYLWNRLPENIVTHFALDGTPNGWGPKGELFVTTVMNLESYIIFLILTWIVPKSVDEKLVYIIRLLGTVIIAAISGGLLYITAMLSLK